MDNNKPKKEDGGGEKKFKHKFLMISFAGFIDLLQFGLSFAPPFGEIANEIIDVVVYFIFYLWFMLNGVNVFNKTGIICSAIEFIPVINALPTFTAMVIKRIAEVEAQELVGVTSVKEAGKALVKREVKKKWQEKKTEIKNKSLQYLSNKSREAIFSRQNQEMVENP